MTCNQCRKLIESIDIAQMPRIERWKVMGHLSECPYCEEWVDLAPKLKDDDPAAVEADALAVEDAALMKKLTGEQE